MRLIYLSPVPWESFAQRPHKFVEWFHSRTGASMLWVDPYPTRLPQLADLWRFFGDSRASAATNVGSRTPSWLKLLSPGGLPIEPLPGSEWVNGKVWRRTLRTIDDFARDTELLLAIGKPSALACLLQRRLSHCPSLYDAMDDFPAFYNGHSRHTLARREHLIAQRADLLWASSTALKIRWESLRNDVHLVPNGLDNSALPEIGASSQLSERKVLGYIGTMASWFDWDWVIALGLARAKDEIRLIGPVFAPPANQLPNNVKLLPACDHATAMRTMSEFDAGLIPFKCNSLTASVDPIKYYEYRALALPVISTAFGEMQFRSQEPGVFISHTMADIAIVTEAALGFERDFDYADKFALQNTWEARFDGARLFT